MPSFGPPPVEIGMESNAANTRRVLLGGTKRLFLSRRPRRSSVRHRQPRLTVTPRSAASKSRQFRERRVGLRTQARQQRLLMARELAVRPSARPRALAMYETLTRNSAANCRTGTPPSTAAGTPAGHSDTAPPL